MKLYKTASIALALVAVASMAVAQDHHDKGDQHPSSHQSSPRPSSKSSSHSDYRVHEGSRGDSPARSSSSRSTSSNDRSFGTRSLDYGSRNSSPRSYDFGTSRSNSARSYDFGSSRNSGGSRSFGGTQSGIDRFDTGSRPSDTARTRSWSDHSGVNWSRSQDSHSSFQPYHTGGTVPSRPITTGTRGFGGRAPSGQTRGFAAHARQFNFAGNRAGFAQGWDADRGHFGLQIQGPNVFQRPEWGGHWRYGYYAPGLAVGFAFAFGGYCFTPFEAPCYVSPWYYYPCLPAYVPATAVTVVPDYNCPWDLGATYSYQPSAPVASYGDESLNQAIDEICSVFSDMKSDAITGLLPESGQVAVFTDGKYDYSLNADDFHSMVSDNTQITPTVSFQVLSVRRDNDGEAIVRCVHTFKNEDGGMDRVYQQYRLREQEGRYVITDFMTSHSPMTGGDNF